MNEIILKGASAIALLSMIAEARVTWPSLNQVTGEEVLMILTGSALANENEKRAAAKAEARRGQAN